MLHWSLSTVTSWEQDFTGAVKLLAGEESKNVLPTYEIWILNIFTVIRDETSTVIKYSRVLL